jgi:hypothetical protein
MHQATVQIALKLDYKEIPLPPKIVIQLEPGEIKFFRRIKYVSTRPIRERHPVGNEVLKAAINCKLRCSSPAVDFYSGRRVQIRRCC